MATWFARPATKTGGGWQAAAPVNQPIYGPQASGAIIDGTETLAMVGHVGKLQAQENFKDNNSSLYTSGIVVTAYDAGGWANGTASAIAHGIMDALGDVAIDLPPLTGDVVLVCDPMSTNIGAEVNMTKAVTPKVL